MEKKNKLGLIAMIVGIVAIVLSIFCGALANGNVTVLIVLDIVSLVAGIVGIILGVKARKDPNTSKGMATTGLVLGILATIWSAIAVICIICYIACAPYLQTLAADNPELSSALEEISKAFK